MKLSASLIFGLLILSLPYPSLNILPKAISQDVQPALSGLLALLSLTFYLKKSNLRSAMPFKVIFPALYLVTITIIYAVTSIFASNNTHLNLVIERLLVLLVAAIFYVSGAGIAHVCSERPKKISKYFTLMLSVLFIYGSIQLLGIALKILLGFGLLFDSERLFRELILTRAQYVPRLVFFITEPSFLPSFLIFILLTAFTLFYFKYKHKGLASSNTKLNSYITKKSRFLAFLLACSVIFSFSISVYIVALTFVVLLFLLTLVQKLNIRNKKNRLKNLLGVILVTAFVAISATLVVFADYVSLLFASNSLFASNPVLLRISNLQADPSSVIRIIKLNALTSCSIENFPFGVGLGGYYDESVQLINQALASVTTSINPLELRQIKAESEQSSGHLYSVIFGTTCEMGVFGLLFFFFMFLPSIALFLATFVSHERDQTPLILSLASVSGVTTLLIFVSGIPFALPYPWIVMGMCNYLLMTDTPSSQSVFFPSASLHSSPLTYK